MSNVENVLGGLSKDFLIGDGADNGTGPPALAAAERWKAANGPVHTFVVGTTSTVPEGQAIPRSLSGLNNFEITCTDNAGNISPRLRLAHVKYSPNSGRRFAQ